MPNDNKRTLTFADYFNAPNKQAKTQEDEDLQQAIDRSLNPAYDFVSTSVVQEQCSLFQLYKDLAINSLQAKNEEHLKIKELEQELNVEQNYAGYLRDELNDKREKFDTLKIAHQDMEINYNKLKSDHQDLKQELRQRTLDCESYVGCIVKFTESGMDLRKQIEKLTQEKEQLKNLLHYQTECLDDLHKELKNVPVDVLGFDPEFY